MPPQQTNITSDTEGDAARLHLDLSAVLALFKQYWRAFRAWRGSSRALQDLNDRDLKDIGLTRGEIDYLTPERAIDRLRDRVADPWGRGVI